MHAYVHACVCTCTHLCVYGENIHVCTDRYTGCFTHKEDVCDVCVHVYTDTQADMPTQKVCVVYVFMYVQIHRRRYPQRDQRRTSYILVYHAPPNALRLDLSLNLELDQEPANPSDPPVSTFCSARVISVHDQHNDRSHVYTASPLTH